MRLASSVGRIGALVLVGGLTATPSGAGGADDPRRWLEPCDALSTADLEDLQIQARRLTVLGLDGWPFSNSGPPVVRLIVEPAFAADWVVSVFRPRVGSCKLVATQAERNVWYANRQERRGEIGLRERPARIPATTYEVEIQCETATILESVWQAMLDRLRERKPTDPLVFDGEYYTFASWRRNVGDLCGVAHSPPAECPADGLTKIGRRLFDLARLPESERGAVVRLIEEMCQKLLHDLSQ